MGWGINVGVLVFAIFVGRGIASLLRARSRGYPPALAGSADPELVQTVEALQSRVAELEERLDFAERMLSTQREGARLEAPKAGA